MSDVDTRVLRSVAGKFPSGVTVITTASPDGTVHGMTANGFVSVSLDPPLILVSVGEQSRTHARLTANERYAVSILGHRQKDVAMQFSGRPATEDSAAPEFDWVDGYPFVPGAIGRLGCRIVDRHRAGDHTLFIGEVEHLDLRDGELPLVFSSGQLFSPLERPLV